MATRRRLARFNRAVTNHLTRPFAAILPGFALMLHTGRRTAKQYRTPVMAYRQVDAFVITLPYTRNTDWVANVLAANGCRLVRLGRTVDVTQPAIVSGARAQETFPRVTAPFLRAIGVHEVLLLTPLPNP